MGFIWVGYNDLKWLSECVNKIIVSNSTEDIFMHRHDGYKAIHVIHHSNRNGIFLEIFEFHSGSRQGVVCIPGGRNKQGWHAFAKLCKGFRDLFQQSNQNGVANLRHRVVVGGLVGHERGKPQITHNALNSNNNVSFSFKSGINSTEKEGLRNSSLSNFNVNTHLNINLELICGPGGKWEVSQANVTQPQAPPRIWN
jgi:hypothetical protein